MAFQKAKTRHGRNSVIRKLASGFSNGHMINLGTLLCHFYLYLQHTSTMRHLRYVHLLVLSIVMGIESIAWRGQAANIRDLRDQRWV